MYMAGKVEPSFFLLVGRGKKIYFCPVIKLLTKIRKSVKKDNIHGTII